MNNAPAVEARAGQARTDRAWKPRDSRAIRIRASSPVTTSTWRGSVVVATTRDAITPRVPFASRAHADSSPGRDRSSGPTETVGPVATNGTSRANTTNGVSTTIRL